MVRDEELRAAARELREFAKVGLREDSARSRLRLLERSTTLRSLPAVQAAGGDSTAQFEYLAQAIIDCLDDMDRARHGAGSPPDAPANGEVDALRHLFGLVDSARRRSWRVRQEQAARSLHISWDHFRHDTQESLLCAIAERLLSGASRAVQAEKAAGAGVGLTAYATQQDILRAMVDHIREERPARADLLELSTSTVRPLMMALHEAGTQVRLLVANPDNAASEWQRGRIRGTLGQLLRSDFLDSDALEVALYGVQPSIRGRRLGELVVLGWYTHRDNRRLDASDPAAAEVWGHDNAVVAGWTSDPSGDVLATWFEREFDRLWSHRLTHHGRAAYRILGLDG